MPKPMREVRSEVMAAFFDGTTPYDRKRMHLYCDHMYDRIVISTGDDIRGIVLREDVDDGSYLPKFNERLQMFLDEIKAA